MKKLLSAFLALVILLATGASALTKEEIYTTSVDSFLSYLNDDDTVFPEELLSGFASLGAYEWSMQYMLYVNILMCVQNNDFSRIQAWLGVLRGNAEFCAYLTEESKNSKVGSVDELEAYANAKKALYRNDVPAALEYFRACPNFMDSTQYILSIEESILSEKYERANELYNSGAYSEAAALFRELESYKNSEALLETCEFMSMLYSLEVATEEEPAATEAEPAATEAEPSAQPATVAEAVPAKPAPVEPIDDSEYVSGDYKYRKLNNGKIEISDYNGSASTLTVPAKIDGLNVYGIGKGAFSNCDSLTQITLPEGLTSVGDRAFYSCYSLTQITLPDSVCEIGSGSFAVCSEFIEFIVSKEHPYLAVIEGVLYHKEEKRLIFYPRGLNLTSYTVPEGILSIEGCAFDNCHSLTQITLPEGVTSVGDYAFFSCDSLTQITLPDSVCEIGANPFRFCDNLQKIIVSKEHPYLAVIEGVLYHKEEKRLICCPMGLKLTSYTVPEGILSVGDFAFENCDSLTQITLPEGLTSVGDYAFYSCSSLTQITLPDSVCEIGANPFPYCDNLQKIIVSKEHPYLAVIEGVLYHKEEKRLICCPRRLNLTSYTVPNGILSVDDYAFYDCDSLKQITLPEGLTSVGDRTFYGCDSLTQITLPEGLTSVGDFAFLDCNSLTQITLPEGVTSVGDYAFENCDSLSTVTVPKSVVSIGSGAFKDCPKLQLMVYTGSYAAQYAKDNGLNYDYVDALDWLNS